MILAGALVLGALIGIFMPVTINHAYISWLVVSIFCVADAFLTELNLFLRKKHGIHVLTRILFNAVFGGVILLIGERLGYDLYIVVLIPFAIRTLNNVNHLKELFTEALGENEIVIFRDRRGAARGRE